MAQHLLFLLISSTAVTAQFTQNALSFTITPNRVSLCGDHVNLVMRIECRVTASASQILNIEIGKKTAMGTNTPIARTVNNAQYTVQVVDNSLRPRLTQTNWASGSLSVSLHHPRKSDFLTYYCSAAYVAGSLRYSETTVTVEADDLRGQVPTCNANNVNGAVSHHAPTTHALAGRCPDGIDDRSEALVLNYCGAPGVNDWKEGPKVVDICCQIPPYTPIATFVFGVYVEDENGVSGVFLGCVENGFSVALQLCGHPPMVVNLTRNSGSGFVENPDNYHLVQYHQSHLGLVG